MQLDHVLAQHVEVAGTGRGQPVAGAADQAKRAAVAVWAGRADLIEAALATRDQDLVDAGHRQLEVDLARGAAASEVRPLEPDPTLRQVEHLRLVLASVLDLEAQRLDGHPWARPPVAGQVEQVELQIEVEVGHEAIVRGALPAGQVSHSGALIEVQARGHGHGHGHGAG